MTERGAICYWDSGKGFGFIKPRPGSDHVGDVFFHVSAVCSDLPVRQIELRLGQLVEFGLAPDATNPKRMRAINVLVRD